MYIQFPAILNIGVRYAGVLRSADEVPIVVFCHWDERQHAEGRVALRKLQDRKKDRNYICETN